MLLVECAVGESSREDSATGVRSAKAAGMRVVGIPTLRGVDIGADAVFGSLTDPRSRRSLRAG